MDGIHGRAWKARIGSYQETAVAAWHGYGSDASRPPCAGRYTDSPWVPSREEIGNEFRLSELFSPHGDASSVSVTVPSLQLVTLMAPFNMLWCIEGHESLGSGFGYGMSSSRCSHYPLCMLSWDRTMWRYLLCLVRFDTSTMLVFPTAGSPWNLCGLYWYLRPTSSLISWPSS